MQVSFRRRARGTVEANSRSKAIAVRFEIEIFNKLSAEADARGMPFAELVRYYVNLGMDAENGTRSV